MAKRAKRSSQCRCTVYVKTPRAKRYRANVCTTTKTRAKAVCKRRRAAGKNCKVVCRIGGGRRCFGHVE